MSVSFSNVWGTFLLQGGRWFTSLARYLTQQNKVRQSGGRKKAPISERSFLPRASDSLRRLYHQSETGEIDPAARILLDLLGRRDQNCDAFPVVD
jgi:hypothetical protein